jgi:hypothetical protein
MKSKDEINEILSTNIHKDLLEEMNFFLRKVNERALFQQGVLPSYDDERVAALGLEVEYFHPTITLDDRMNYIMDNIVCNEKQSDVNKLGNTIISHFYGARGIHQNATGIQDPKEALVDFDLIGKEQLKYKNTGKIGEYTQHLRNIAIQAKINKLAFWGTTELHTSLQTAGRRTVNEIYYNNARHEDKGTWSNINEFIGSWTWKKSNAQPNKTIMDAILTAPSLKETFRIMTGENLIGDYYGYHGSVGISINPNLPFNHDERFCMPGPGARHTLGLLYPILTKNDVSYADMIIWFRENQKTLLKGIEFHSSTFNRTVNGIKIFKDDQNELKTYGTEVFHCQFGIYLRLKENPHLIKHRKVSRNEDFINEKCVILNNDITFNFFKKKKYDK